jgi:hypothetical protein
MKQAILMIVFLLQLVSPVLSQTTNSVSDSDRIARLESQVKELQERNKKAESELEDAADKFSLMVLYMFFCGLWAGLSGRSFWLWFFLGIFNVFTLVALLFLSGQDWKKRRAMP